MGKMEVVDMSGLVGRDGSRGFVALTGRYLGGRVLLDVMRFLNQIEV
jgi:hypothetical protein